ncbi:MAG: polysaccharide deacetylase family protein [Candidatus Andersenbacteria bacterium]
MTKRGAVTIVFDDGYKQVYETVVPMLTKYRIPGVFAVPLDFAAIERSEKRLVTPWQEWKKIETDGHEIAAHTVSHRNLTTLQDVELDQELREPEQVLGATTVVYPGGAYNEQVVATAQKYYRAGRTVVRGFESFQPADSMRLKSFNFTQKNFSVWKVNALATWAYLTNTWLIETYHMVDDDELMHSVPLSAFKKHLEFIKRLPIATETIRQHLSL